MANYAQVAVPHETSRFIDVEAVEDHYEETSDSDESDQGMSLLSFQTFADDCKRFYM
jgi:hypothetical protein